MCVIGWLRLLMHLDDGMHGILIPKCFFNHPKKPPGTLKIWKFFWYTVDLDKAGYMHGGTGVGSISRSPIHQAWKCMGASAAALAGSMCYFRRRGHVFLSQKHHPSQVVQTLLHWTWPRIHQADFDWGLYKDFLIAIQYQSSRNLKS